METSPEMGRRRARRSGFGSPLGTSSPSASFYAAFRVRMVNLERGAPRAILGRRGTMASEDSMGHQDRLAYR